MTCAQLGDQKVPAVSVIVPAYGTTPYIAQALDSVLAQGFRDLEIIVVNDGSPDTPELERVLLPYMPNIIYVKQPNHGIGHARNTGFHKARAPLIALLDSDDYWAPDYLACQMGVLAAEPTADAVYPNAVLFGNPRTEGKTYMDIFPSEGEVSFLSLVSGKCNVLAPAMILRRSAVERAGWYDPALRHAEDFDLWLRLVKSGGKILYHRRVAYHLRRRADSLSHQTVSMCESMLWILGQSERRFSLTAEERAAVDQRQRRIGADLELERGKSAFSDGEVAVAIRHIAAANEYQPRWKLRFVLFLMKVAPGLLKLLMRVRARS
jgi:glycosyltransferase involved in cell wall biosynthesis